MKKTILIFMAGYLPGVKYGGPIRRIENFVNTLSEIYDFKIICNDHDWKEAARYPNVKEGWNQVGNAQVNYINEKQWNAKNFRKVIKPFEHNIQLVYVLSVYYVKMTLPAIKMARFIKVNILLAPCGELLDGEIYEKGKKKMIKKLSYLFVVRTTCFFRDIFFLATGDEEVLSVRNQLNIDETHIFNLPNIIVRNTIEKINDKKVGSIKIVFISRMVKKKNLDYAIDVVSNISNKYKVSFDIYGFVEDEEYWNKCLYAINQIQEEKKHITIEYKGSLKQEEVKETFSKYDCFLFPTLSENYGYVIVEAMLASCPVILSEGTTPWDDYHMQGGYVIPLSNQGGFVEYLEELARMNAFSYAKLLAQNEEYIKNVINIEELRQRYVDMIEGISENKCERGRELGEK